MFADPEIIALALMAGYTDRNEFPHGLRIHLILFAKRKERK